MFKIYKQKKEQIQKAVIRISELEEVNLKQRQKIISLQNANETLKNERDAMKQQNKALNDEIGDLMGEQKEKDLELKRLQKEIKELKISQIDPSKYLEWGHDEITAFICDLEGGRYRKYENVLNDALKEEGVEGAHLKEVDSADIKRWGIKSFQDIKDLTKSIQKMVNQQKYQNEGAQTPFIPH